MINMYVVSNCVLTFPAAPVLPVDTVRRRPEVGRLVLPQLRRVLCIMLCRRRRRLRDWLSVCLAVIGDSHLPLPVLLLRLMMMMEPGYTMYAASALSRTPPVKWKSGVGFDVRRDKSDNFV